MAQPFKVVGSPAAIMAKLRQLGIDPSTVQFLGAEDLAPPTYRQLDPYVTPESSEQHACVFTQDVMGGASFKYLGNPVTTAEDCARILAVQCGDIIVADGLSLQEHAFHLTIVLDDPDVTPEMRAANGLLFAGPARLIPIRRGALYMEFDLPIASGLVIPNPYDGDQAGLQGALTAAVAAKFGLAATTLSAPINYAIEVHGKKTACFLWRYSSRTSSAGSIRAGMSPVHSAARAPIVIATAAAKRTVEAELQAELAQAETDLAALEAAEAAGGASGSEAGAASASAATSATMISFAAPGIINVGNSCFVSALLQALYATKLFRRTVLRFDSRAAVAASAAAAQTAAPEDLSRQLSSFVATEASAAAAAAADGGGGGAAATKTSSNAFDDVAAQASLLVGLADDAGAAAPATPASPRATLERELHAIGLVESLRRLFVHMAKSRLGVIDANSSALELVVDAPDVDADDDDAALEAAVVGRYVVERYAFTNSARTLSAPVFVRRSEEHAREESDDDMLLFVLSVVNSAAVCAATHALKPQNAWVFATRAQRHNIETLITRQGVPLTSAQLVSGEIPTAGVFRFGDNTAAMSKDVAAPFAWDDDVSQQQREGGSWRAAVVAEDTLDSFTEATKMANAAIVKEAAETIMMLMGGMFTLRRITEYVQRAARKLLAADDAPIMLDADALSEASMTAMFSPVKEDFDGEEERGAAGGAADADADSGSPEDALAAALERKLAAGSGRTSSLTVRRAADSIGFVDRLFRFYDFDESTGAQRLGEMGSPAEAFDVLMKAIITTSDLGAFGAAFPAAASEEPDDEEQGQVELEDDGGASASASSGATATAGGRLGGGVSIGSLAFLRDTLGSMLHGDTRPSTGEVGAVIKLNWCESNVSDDVYAALQRRGGLRLRESDDQLPPLLVFSLAEWRVQSAGAAMMSATRSAVQQQTFRVDTELYIRAPGPCVHSLLPLDKKTLAQSRKAAALQGKIGKLVAQQAAVEAMQSGALPRDLDDRSLAVQQAAAQLQGALAALREQETEAHSALRDEMRISAKENCEAWGHYLLRSVIVRKGAHYICYTRDEASTDDESMWIKSDDHVVTRVTLATARDDPSDGWATTPNGASYATELFYENQSAIDDNAIEIARAAEIAPPAESAAGLRGVTTTTATLIAVAPPTMARQLSSTSESCTTSSDDALIEHITAPIERLAGVFAEVERKKANARREQEERDAAARATAELLTPALEKFVLTACESIDAHLSLELSNTLATNPSRGRALVGEQLDRAMEVYVRECDEAAVDFAVTGARDAAISRSALIAKCTSAYYNDSQKKYNQGDGPSLAAVIAKMVDIRDLESFNLTLQFSAHLPPVERIDEHFFATMNQHGAAELVMNLFNGVYEELRREMLLATPTGGSVK